MTRAYLVGPDVFHPQPKALFDPLRTLCQRHGVQGMEPVDGGLSQGAPATPETAHRIYQGNIDLLRGCDGILANTMAFRGAEIDSGSAFEIGYAKALGKPVVGYGFEDRTYAQSIHRLMGIKAVANGALIDTNGLPVENFDCPLPSIVWNMMDGAMASTYEAAQLLAELCQEPGVVPTTGSDGETVVLTVERIAAMAHEPSMGAARRALNRLLAKVRNAPSISAEVDPFRGVEPSGAMAVLIGYAVGLGKPVTLVLADHRSHAERLADLMPLTFREGMHWCEAHGWLVENMGLPVNLMLACSAHSIVRPTACSLLQDVA